MGYEREGGVVWSAAGFCSFVYLFSQLLLHSISSPCVLRFKDMNVLGKAAGNFGPALKTWPLSFKVCS